MQTPLLFLNIDEGDIALILSYIFIHPLSLILFIITYASKGKIYIVSQITLLIQLIMSLIAVFSFFNLISLASVIASVAMVFVLFKQKKTRDTDILQASKQSF